MKKFFGSHFRRFPGGSKPHLLFESGCLQWTELKGPPHPFPCWAPKAGLAIAVIVGSFWSTMHFPLELELGGNTASLLQCDLQLIQGDQGRL